MRQLSIEKNYKVIRQKLFIIRKVSVPKHIHFKGFCAEPNFSEVILSIKLYIIIKIKHTFIASFLKAASIKIFNFQFSIFTFNFLPLCCRSGGCY